MATPGSLCSVVEPVLWLLMAPIFSFHYGEAGLDFGLSL